MNIVNHTLENLEDLVSLSLSFYPESEISTAKYLEWEYKKNISGEAIISIAKDDNKTIGQYIVIPVEIKRGSESYKASLSLNTLTKIDYQGKGLFPAMAREVFSRCKPAGINFTFGFPNASSFGGFISKLNFKHIGDLPLYILNINLIKTIYHYLFQSKHKLNTELNLNLNIDHSSVAELDLERDIDQLNVFLSNFYQRNKFTTKRSVNWLKWRYVDIPIRNYKLLKETKSGVIVGIAILRAKIISGVRTGIVVDSILTDHSIELFPFIRKLGKKNSLDLVIFSAPKDSEEVFQATKNGFFLLPHVLMFKKLPFIIRSHNLEPDETIFEFKNWFLTFGDYDIF